MHQRTFRLSPADLDRAFAERRFVVLYQPQVSLTTGEVVAAEAFVRWNHPAFGLMAPGLFLDFIESQGRQNELTAYVLGEALATAKAWQLMGRNWRVSVNVSGADIGAPDFAEFVSACLSEVDLPPERLVIEAPESPLGAGDPRLAANLQFLRALGCGIALDSGGALPLDAAELSPCPFTEIKIGGSAIIRFARHVQRASVGRISRRLAFARRNGLTAIAVGVEDEVTLEALKNIGFGAAQGAYVQRPVAAADLDHWDGNWRRETMHAPFPATDAATQTQTPPPPHAAADPNVGRNRNEPRVSPAPDIAGAAAPNDAHVAPVASPARLIEKIPAAPQATSNSGMDGWDDDDDFGPAAHRPARDDDGFVDPMADASTEDDDSPGAISAPPLTAAMIDRPDRRTAKASLITRKIPGIERPIAMQVAMAETKADSVTGTDHLPPP